jgi:hypothetical protein
MMTIAGRWVSGCIMELLIHIADKTRAMPTNAQSIWRTNQLIVDPLLKEGLKQT